MTSIRIGQNSENELHLSSNQTVCFSAEQVHIICLSGAVWITWAGGREKCLTRGDSLVMTSRFKICLQAFTPSRVRILETPGKTVGIRRGMAELAAGFKGLTHFIFALENHKPV